MTRTLAIDYGQKRIGLAITDERGKIALPLATVPTGKSFEESTRNIESATKDYTLRNLVVGLPLLPNGKEGDMSRATRAFAEHLAHYFSLPVVLFDERFTSIRAHQSLGAFSRKARTKVVDRTAALILLQDYLGNRS
ncbi:MAG: Holliday junction resolvase RuvX [Chlamydiota bacterium]